MVVREGLYIEKENMALVLFLGEELIEHFFAY
jgi:hypothetical protein